MKLTTIYRLCDPRLAADDPQRVRYIGKTVYRLGKRLTTHVALAKAGGECHAQRWIRGLLVEALRPVIESIEICGDDWAERECFWIAEYRRRGVLLTNVHPGGGLGAEGYRHTEQARAAMLGRPRSAEVRAAISAAQRGRTKSAEERENMSAAKKASSAVQAQIARLAEVRRGQTFSAEVRASMGRPGRIVSEEARAKIGASHRGRKRSAETDAKMRAVMKASVANTEHMRRLAEARRGTKRSPETNAKIVASYLRQLAAKKQGCEGPLSEP